jgi:hypothetical protein
LCGVATASPPRVDARCQSDECVVEVPKGARTVELHIPDAAIENNAKASLATRTGTVTPHRCEGGICAVVQVDPTFVLGRLRIRVRAARAPSLKDTLAQHALQGGETVPRLAMRASFSQTALVGGGEHVAQLSMPALVGPPAVVVTQPSPLDLRSPRTKQASPAPDDRSFADVVLVGNERGFGCTGVLVAPRVVLTAKHCLPATQVVFTSRLADPLLAIEVTASRGHDTEDVAALTLAKASPWAPRTFRTTAQPPPEGDVLLVGFGFDDPSREAGFGVKRRARVVANGWGCDRSRPGTTGCHPASEMVVPPLSGADTCNGDSGGPVLEPSGATFRLIAITSRPTVVAADACGHGGIYTRVDAIAAWLETYIREVK